MNRLALSFLLIGLTLPAYVQSRDIRSANLEPFRNGKSRPPILVPTGATNLLSRGCAVTSSTPNPTQGTLSAITDGDKNAVWEDPTIVRLGTGIQWVQIDLGSTQHVCGVCIWRHHCLPQIYKDMIVRISSDPEFITDVTTVFNNDHDNSSCMGQGTDKEYVETPDGRPIPVPGIRARYVRVYSNGYTDSKANCYTEIEVYGGTPASEETVPLQIEVPKSVFAKPYR